MYGDTTGIGIGTADPEMIFHVHGTEAVNGYVKISTGRNSGYLKLGGDEAYIESINRTMYLNFTSTQPVYIGRYALQVTQTNATGGPKVLSTGPLEVQSHVTASGNISGSAASTGSFGRVEAAAFAGDGAGLTNVPDYVFEPDYNLKTLNELETFVSQSKHLPNVPSIDDMPEWASYTVGDRDMLLLEKIEELTLYIIELHKRVESLESQLPTNNPTT